MRHARALVVLLLLQPVGIAGAQEPTVDTLKRMSLDELTGRRTHHGHANP